MAQVLVRQLNEQVVERLKKRAKEHGRSLRGNQIVYSGSPLGGGTSVMSLTDSTACAGIRDVGTGQRHREENPARGALTFPRFHRHLHKWENPTIGGLHEHEDATIVYGDV